MPRMRACKHRAGGAARAAIAEVDKEEKRFMRWIFPLVAVVGCLASSAGCGGLGWYRAAGDSQELPPPTMPFTIFSARRSQLYPFSPPQVESSAIEALGDLGFRVVEPPSHLPGRRRA